MLKIKNTVTEMKTALDGFICGLKKTLNLKILQYKLPKLKSKEKRLGAGGPQK